MTTTLTQGEKHGARSYLSELSTEQINAESTSLETMDGQEIAALMNRQDQGVVEAVAQAVRSSAA